MVVELVDWLQFFVGAVVDLTICLAISGAVLTGADMSVDFFELFLL